MGSGENSTRYYWAALILLALFFPVICSFDKYLLHVAITVILNVSLATSMWLIWSLGFISFAHAGFMGIGAYGSALLLTKLGIPMWYGMWIGAAISGAVALVISVPLMRTRAVYFFMASWAVGEVIKRNFAYFREFFGGWNGVFDIEPPVLALAGLEINFADRLSYYYLALLIVGMIVLSIYRINRSRTGMIYWSIHENELLAQHIGINVFKHKVMCFAVACFLAGLTGALYAHYQTYISPKSFDIWKSEFALVMFFGVIVIASVVLLPGGLETIPDRVRRVFKRFKS